MLVTSGLPSAPDISPRRNNRRYVPIPEVAFTGGLLPSESQKPREAVVTQLPVTPTKAVAPYPSQAIQEIGESLRRASIAASSSYLNGFFSTGRSEKPSLEFRLVFPVE